METIISYSFARIVGLDLVMTVDLQPGISLADRCGGSQLFVFMTLLESLFRSQSDIVGKTPKFIETPQPEYDFIVIGAGSAGCVVAARLSENPRHRVLLIEAGGAQPIGVQPTVFTTLYINSSVDWKYATQPNGVSYLSSPGQSVQWPRGKMLGGTGGFNGMQYLRGNRQDFDRWAALGNAGWDFKSVLPYFKSVEHNANVREDENDDDDGIEAALHGTHGPQWVERPAFEPEMGADMMRAAKELGYPLVADLNGDTQTGFARLQLTSKDGVRQSSARAFLGPAFERKNLDVWPYTRATRVHVDRRTRRATAVDTISERGDGARRTVRARAEVIVCCGAVESPKLLLLSGIGAAAELRRFGIEPVVELPGVGRNLLNHLGVMMLYNAMVPNQFYMNARMAREYFLHRRGPISSMSSSVLGKLAGRSRTDRNDPDLAITFGTDMIFPDQLCSKTGLSDHVRPNQIFYLLPSLQQTQSTGHIALASADPLVPPAIHPNLLSVPSDLERLLEPIMVCQRLASQTLAMRKYNATLVPALGTPCMKLPIGSPAYWRCVIRHRTDHVQHPTGTCRMAPRTDRLAVVNGRLQVYGVRNLRVMDASIMPTTLSGNPNACTQMIGEKGAAMVRRLWQNRRL